MLGVKRCGGFRVLACADTGARNPRWHVPVFLLIFGLGWGGVENLILVRGSFNFLLLFLWHPNFFLLHFSSSWIDYTQQ